MGLAMIFKLGAMPYDMVERSMTAFGEEVVPRIRDILDRDAAADHAAATPVLRIALGDRSDREPPAVAGEPAGPIRLFGCPAQRPDGG